MSGAVPWPCLLKIFGYLVLALMLVLSAGAMGGRFVATLLPDVPSVRASVSITLTGCGLVGGACINSGWNGTTSRPNPTIIVTQGDTVSLSLASGDLMQHEFILDIDGDDTDLSDCGTIDRCSHVFPPSAVFTFSTAGILPGNYTYLCFYHPYAMVGTFEIQKSQTVGGVGIPAHPLEFLVLAFQLLTAAIAALAISLVFLRLRSRRSRLMN